MHQKRQETTTKLPIKRKGTTYVARASSHIQDSVPIVIALRDMLKLARTAKEVQEMIKLSLLKINGRKVKDYRESIKLFNILEADKSYQLTLSPTGKFAFEESKLKDSHLCKVINKKIQNSHLIQLNFHDGSNVISKDKIKVGDSVHIDFSGKITKHISLEKGKEALIISGKYIGKRGKIDSVEGKSVSININGGQTSLKEAQVIVL